jgi:hypothetical protein
MFLQVFEFFFFKHLNINVVNILRLSFLVNGVCFHN